MTDKEKIQLEGAYNFRDFGGYETSFGKKVVKGKLYRSDELSKLTPKDQAQLAELGLTTIIDFRNEKERVDNEDLPIGEARVVYLDPIANIAALASSENGEEKPLDFENMTAELAKFLMTEQNREFVRSERCQEVYKEMLEIYLDDNETAVVQHCRGGKDRTGYGVALIHLLLGVSKEDIMHDYLLTNVYKKEKNERSLKELMEQSNNPDFVQAVRYFKEADASFLTTALEMIEEYGGIERYAKEELGLTEEQITKLREKYLEDEGR
ncbi:protein tyrosine phosphatase [Enterococcus sp. JM4C]|uniref:tyrosine-protein phosphatase n=1 Tax=Candidatus Enterococcus huntleyi TaxID=1857217 RepID=UPI00137A93B6|nr:tyrosine-protein phosphatase [Enterococcus sp. JM4C]KAF1298853.1 protein tyrosine phosphatase [Enterococcus sp. JM4C]